MNEADRNKAALNSQWAKGVGVAGYLNAMIRDGDTIEMATQSNLIGANWSIGAIKADPEGKIPPYYQPTGMVTTLYNKYHGNSRLFTTQTNIPDYKQPYKMGGGIAPDQAIVPRDKVLVLDAVATSGDKAIYFHVINRDFSKQHTITIDLSAFMNLKGTAKLHSVTGRLDNQPKEGEPLQVAQFADKDLKFSDGKLVVTLPQRTVSVIEIFK